MSLAQALQRSRLGGSLQREQRSAVLPQQGDHWGYAVGLPIECGGGGSGARRLPPSGLHVRSCLSRSSSDAPGPVRDTTQWACVRLTAAAPAQPRRSTVCAAAAAAAGAAAATGASPAAATAAVLVGWLVIAGSCIRSLPQILRILKNNSVRGLSLTSFTSELLCYMVSVAYNVRMQYPFSTFGDTAICAVQNAAIIGLIFKLDDVPRRAALALSAALAGATCWLFGACPTAALRLLQTGSVALLALGGRMPQILLNIKRGNSGELSLLSCLLSFVGNLMRVFTSATLVGDPIILGSAATQAVLNGILSWQCVATALALRREQAAAAAAAPPAAA